MFIPKFKILSKDKLKLTEQKDLELFWSNKKFESFYFNKNRFWSEKIAKLVFELNVNNVFEFGCAGGANLAAIKSKNPKVEVLGYDINKSYINLGRKKYNLNIKYGSNKELFNLKSNSFDFVFTVSVIDHVLTPRQIINKLIEVAKVYVLCLEPSCQEQEEGKFLAHFSEKDGKYIDMLPFTYNWHIEKYFKENKRIESLLIENFPLYNSSSGPYYKIFLGKIKK